MNKLFDEQFTTADALRLKLRWIDEVHIHEQLRALYAQKRYRIAVAPTGAGAGLQQLLWNTGGASSAFAG